MATTRQKDDLEFFYCLPYLQFLRSKLDNQYQVIFRPRMMTAVQMCLHFSCDRRSPPSKTFFWRIAVEISRSRSSIPFSFSSYLTLRPRLVGGRSLFVRSITLLHTVHRHIVADHRWPPRLEELSGQSPGPSHVGHQDLRLLRGFSVSALCRFFSRFVRNFSSFSPLYVRNFSSLTPSARPPSRMGPRSNIPLLLFQPANIRNNLPREYAKI